MSTESKSLLAPTKRFSAGVLSCADTVKSALLFELKGVDTAIYPLAITHSEVKEVDRLAVVTSLSGDTYAYSLGDAPVEIKLAGVVVRDAAADSPAQLSTFWPSYKASVPKAAPVQLLLDGTVYRLCLHEFVHVVQTDEKEDIEIVGLRGIGCREI